MHQVFHQYYTIDRRSIAEINNSIDVIEKHMHSASEKLDSSLLDIEMKNFFSSQISKLLSSSEKQKAKIGQLEKELEKSRKQYSEQEGRIKQVNLVFQQVADTYEQNLIGMLAKLMQDIVGGRPEDQIPLATM